MDTGIESLLARRLNTFLPMSQDELRCLAQMQSAPLAVKRGQQLVSEGQTGHKAFVLQTGWASSYKDLPNGTRQIIIWDRRRLYRTAQRASQNRGSFVRGAD